MAVHRKEKIEAERKRKCAFSAAEIAGSGGRAELRYHHDVGRGDLQRNKLTEECQLDGK